MLSARVNVEMEILKQPANGEVWPSRRTSSGQHFFTRVVRLADLDNTTMSQIRNSFAGDLTITHVVQAPRGIEELKEGSGVRAVREKRGRSWPTLTTPIYYTVKRIVDDPGYDFIRIGLVRVTKAGKLDA